MNDLKIFESSEFGQVRIVDNNGEPWFVAMDVCAILVLDNVGQAVSYLDDDEKAYVDANIINDDAQGGRAPLIISESGLYSLVLRSRKPKAKAFKRWITQDVLPTIRKHGGYLTADKIEEVLFNPDTIIRLATDLKEERAARQLAELERDEAHRTKAQISSSREASVMGKLSAANRRLGAAEHKTEVLEDELGRGKTWKAVTAVEWIKRTFNLNSLGVESVLGRHMSALSREMGYEIRHTEHPRHGTVATYHADVFAAFQLQMAGNKTLFLKCRRRRPLKERGTSCAT